MDHTLRWDQLSPFDKMSLLRSLLDGTSSTYEVNYSIWRGLGLVPKDRAVPYASCTCDGFPDVFTDSEALANLDAQERLAAGMGK